MGATAHSQTIKTTKKKTHYLHLRNGDVGYVSYISMGWSKAKSSPVFPGFSPSVRLFLHIFPLNLQGASGSELVGHGKRSAGDRKGMAQLEKGCDT